MHFLEGDGARVWRAFVLAAVVASAMDPVRANDQNRIVSISPECAAPGASVTVEGFGFGAENAVVFVGETRAQIVRATGHRIDFVVPSDAPAGPTAVSVRHRKGGQAGTIAFEVGCGGGFRVVLDSGREASGTLGAAGGSITTTGADGKVYTLTIPPGALAGDTNITVTPVISFGRPPLTGGIAAAAHFAPAGLEFLVPVRFEIQLPAPSALTPLSGFSSADDGSGLELLGVAIDGSTLTVSLPHFTVAGAGAPTVADLAGLQVPLSIQATDTLLDILGGWIELYDLNTGDPVFDTAIQIVTDSLAIRANEACSQTQTFLTQGNPFLAEQGLHFVMEALGKLIRVTGGVVDLGCVPGLLQQIIVLAGEQALADPSPGKLQLLVLLSADADLLTEEGLAALALGKLEAGLRKVLELAHNACSGSNPSDGISYLDGVVGFEDQLSSLGLADDFDAERRSCGFRITPTSATVLFGGQVLFSATDLLAPPLVGVQWSVEPPPAGSIDANGLFTAGNAETICQVKATNATNSARSVTADVDIRPPVTVHISPTQATLACAQTQLFTATVSGTTNTGVNWSNTGGSAGGSVTQSGSYTAGTPGNYEVKATSQADTTKFATAAVTVQPATLTVSPASASVTPFGGTQQFSARINGVTTTNVVWTATGGTISASGLFTAVDSGTFTVRATHNGCSVFGEATVVVADHPPMEFVAECYLDRGAVVYRANVRTDTGANGNAVITVQDAFPAIGTIFDFPLSANSGYNVATTGVYFCNTVEPRSYVVTATATSVDYPNDPPITKTFTFTAQDAGGWIPGENCNFTVTVSGDCDVNCSGDVCVSVP